LRLGVRAVVVAVVTGELPEFLAVVALPVAVELIHNVF
jgi:hypothetical protein